MTEEWVRGFVYWSMPKYTVGCCPPLGLGVLLVDVRLHSCFHILPLFFKYQDKKINVANSKLKTKLIGIINLLAKY